MIKHSQIVVQCLLVGVFLLADNAFALLADSKATIEIKAQTVIIDERKGLSIYSGDVRLTQGSLILSAENIKLFSTENKITKFIAIGTSKQPAHYRQNQPNQSRFIEASAENISYSPLQGLIHLKGNAHLVRGFESFSAHTLDYDTKFDKINAKKSKEGTQRVRFKIKL